MENREQTEKDQKRKVTSILRKTRNFIERGELDEALKDLREAEDIGFNLQQGLDRRYSMKDIYYHFLVCYQLMGDSPKSLQYALKSLGEEILLADSSVLAKNTRTGTILVALFNATEEFLEDYSKAIARYLHGNVPVPYAEMYREFRHRLDVKKAFNAGQHFRHLAEAIERAQVQLRSLLERPPKLQKTPNQLILYKRWNSVTPEYPDREESLGGGYFLVWNNKGVVIDPGYGFLRQLFCDSRRFGPNDIDMVIVTHAHDDHTHEVETIYSLDSKLNKSKKPPFVGSEGGIIKFSRLLKNNDITTITLLGEGPTVRRQQATIESLMGSQGIELKAMNTFHHELPWMDTNTGVALRFNLESSGKRFAIGITGDGRLGEKQHRDSLCRFLRGCDLLVVHVGDIWGTSSHLGIVPAGMLIGRLKPKLTVLSEFGVEFGNRRTITEKTVRMISALRGNSNKPPPIVIAGDSGLSIQIPSLKVLKSDERPSLPRSWIQHNRIVTHEAQERRRASSPDWRVFYRR